MGKRSYFIITLTIVLSVTAVFTFSSSDAITVKITPVKQAEMKSAIRVTGSVINDKTVTMTALLNGQIEGMLVQKGDQVKSDQVLAYLDKREADAELAKAEAVQAREEQSVVEAQAKLRRMKNVKKSGGSSQQMIEDAQAELSAAQARLRVAQAELRVARIHREKIELRAPFDGVITEKTTEKGQWVEAGTKLFTLVGKEGREIEVKVDAGDSGTVKLGQVVELTCDAFPGVKWQEKIHWIAPSIIQDTSNEALNTFAVRISLGETAPPLLLGQQVDAYIVIENKKEVVQIPFSAIHTKKGKQYVAVIENNKVNFKQVKTGMENNTHIEVLSGVSPGDAVILADGKKLTEGLTVTVKQE